MLLPRTFISAAPIHCLTYFPASMPLIRNMKTQFLAFKLHIEMFICVCGLTHVSHELDVHVPDVFLPITYIRTHGRAVEKKFTCVMSGVYSIEHSTSGHFLYLQSASQNALIQHISVF